MGTSFSFIFFSNSIIHSTWFESFSTSHFLIRMFSVLLRKNRHISLAKFKAPQLDSFDLHILRNDYRNRLSSLSHTDIMKRRRQEKKHFSPCDETSQFTLLITLNYCHHVVRYISSIYWVVWVFIGCYRKIRMILWPIFIL